MALELKHNDIMEYIKQSNGSRDPHLTTILKNIQSQNSTTDLNMKNLLAIDILIKKLTETHILPLDLQVNRQDSFQRFWETYTTTKPKPTDLDQNIGTLNEMFEELPMKFKMEMESNFRLGKPTLRKSSHLSIDVSSPIVDGDNRKERKLGGFVKGITNLFRWGSEKSKTNIEEDAKETLRRPEESTNGLDDDGFISQLMQENSKLRNTLTVVRQELNGSNRKLSNMEQQFKLRDEIYRTNDNKKFNNVKKAKISKLDEKTSSSDNLSSQEPYVGSSDAVAIAAGISAGIQTVNAIRKQKKKQKKPVRADASFETRVMLSPEPIIPADILAVSAPFQKSGHRKSTLVDKQSDHRYRNKSEIVSMTAFKEENDHIAKMFQL
jgi:hypothetical protein